MNIAIATTEFVSETNFDGGLANYTYKLAKWLMSQQHDVTVYLCSNKDETTKFDGIKIIKVFIPDLRWQYKYKFEKFGLKFLINEKKYFRLEFEANAQYINRSIEMQHQIRKIDIVHYPHISGLALYCPKYLPSVVRLSSSTRLCQELGGYGNSDLAGIMQEQIETEAMKKADAVFGPSKMVAALTENVIDKRIQIIETPYLKPAEALDDSIYYKYLNNRNYVLFFGSIGLIKGVGTIADMIFELFEQQPDLHFVFVGKKLENKIGELSVWDYLLGKAEHHKNRIIRIEPLKHPQLFPIIQQAQCVALPSRIDNFPNTCIEAMANSKIVIGTIGNGFDQLIEDGKSGFVIPVDDSRALLRAITTVLNLSIEEKLKIEDAAKLRSELLHPDIVLGQVVELYQHTISNFNGACVA